MKDLTLAERACARADELVTYLYGEASRAESAEFLSHARQCAVCRAELSEFAEVRQSVGAWRAEMLSSLAPATAEADVKLAREAGKTRLEQRRSAFVALREFFTLSPAWMRAATACAAVLFCALLAVAFVHFFARPEPTVVNLNNRADTVYTQQEADKMVAEAVERERRAWQQQNQTEQTVAQKSGPASVPSPRRFVSSKSVESNPLMAKNNNARRATRSVKLSEREQLAEVLLSQESSRSDENLPRLSDLLGDADESNE